MYSQKAYGVVSVLEEGKCFVDIYVKKAYFNSETEVSPGSPTTEVGNTWLPTFRKYVIAQAK